jgi:hypothetical protein
MRPLVTVYTGVSTSVGARVVWRRPRASRSHSGRVSQPPVMDMTLGAIGMVYVWKWIDISQSNL